MAYVKINSIKSGAHLKNSLEYILDNEKTNDRLYTDAYHTTPDPEYAERDFKETQLKEVIKKGNNFAWHIKQSFSPEDKVTPEQALEIGKELMRRMYPNYEYVIATHNDKEHIHNHIIINSVNFEDYHKLVSNKYSLAKLRKISDDLCRENKLSVIEEKSKTHKQKLKQDIDEAILKSSSFIDFVSNMQQAGYNINYGKYISFKNSEMKRYIRSSSISIDYTEAMIKHRIKSKKETTNETRTIYDDKISYMSKRKMLQTEIDASIKKAKTYEDFIADMNRKGFQSKQGKYLSFKGENFEKFIRADFLKDKNRNLHYTNAMIRYRIENKEEYNDLMQNRVAKVIDLAGKHGGLQKWAEKENFKIIDKTRDFCSNLAGFEDGVWFGSGIMYAVFLPQYEIKAAELNDIRQKSAATDEKIKELTKAVKAIDICSRLGPVIKSYENVRVSGLSDDELKVYRSNKAKWAYNYRITEQTKANYGILDTEILNNMLNRLKADKTEIQKELTKKEIEFENWENVKYNFEAICGLNVTPEQANIALEEALKREAEEKAKRNIIKKVFRLHR